MKNGFTFLMLLISFMSYSQSNMGERDPINQQRYESALKWNNSSIAISRYKTATIDEKMLVLKTDVKICKESNGILLTLSTGEILRFDMAKIICSQLDTNKYSFTGSILLTPELYAKLSQIEITEFKLGKVVVPVVFRDEGENLKELFKFSEKY